MDYITTLHSPKPSLAAENENVLNESTLIEAAKADPGAFEALYWRYKDRIYRYMRTRCTSDEDAADLTQQVFLQALPALSRYRSRGGIPFAAWLFRIANNIAVDRYRHAKQTISWDLLPEDMHENRDQDPEAIFLQQEKRMQIREALGKLDPAKRELLALRFAAGLSSAEIAETIGKSHASVRKQLTRILHTLQKDIQGAQS
jgi:RNA polymerase sigma-70 factor, ECF subfamily